MPISQVLIKEEYFHYHGCNIKMTQNKVNDVNDTSQVVERFRNNLIDSGSGYF